eukprot:403360760
MRNNKVGSSSSKYSMDRTSRGRCSFLTKHFNLQTLNPKFRLENEQFLFNLILYAVYCAFDVVLLGMTASRLSFEKSSLCLAADTYQNHYFTTQRKDITPTMRAMMGIMLAYYSVDFLRCTFMIFYMLFKIEVCNKVYMFMSVNELLLIILCIGVPVLRHTFPGKLCSGDYPLFKFDANFIIQGEWLYYMTFIILGYSCFCCWTIHLISTYVASRKRYQ